MKRFLIVFIVFAVFAFCPLGFGQNADDPATKDDVILYLRTMHSHDLLEKTMRTEFEAMQELQRAQILKEKGGVPADFDARFRKETDELIRDMPFNDIMQAMIPVYQKYFTKADIEAMNSFYSSPVGQKVLEELPLVMKEGLQNAMPILNKYVSESKDRMRQEEKEIEKDSDQKPAKAPND